MRRRIDPLRRCLPVSEWPAIDQDLWRCATRPVDALDENRSSASAWRPATAHKNRRGYGRWLSFLSHFRVLLDSLPADRVTNANVQRYVETLREQGLAPYSVSGRVAELLGVMIAFAPERDWSWLKSKLNYLVRLAEEAHEATVPALLAPEIARKAMAALGKFENLERQLKIHEAVAYRDWLMVSFMSLHPVRLKNFTALSVGVDLRQVGNGWEMNVPGVQTKTWRPIRASVPEALACHLRFYCTHVRPILLRRCTTDRLWLSWTGQGMSEHSIYLRVTAFTEKQFGQAINPHAFRHIAATSISILKPEKIDTARALLGHSSKKTTLQHYVAADSLIASQRHAQIITRLRMRLKPPTNLPAPRKLFVRRRRHGNAL